MVDDHRRARGGTVAGVAASLTALVLAAPRPPAALAVLRDAAAVSDPTAPLVAAVALAAWAVSGWLALTVGLVLLSRLPGLLGRTGRAVSARVAPAAVRHAVEVALGLTVAVGVVAPSTALAAPQAPAPAMGSWNLDWPSTTTAVPTPAAPATPAAPPTPTATATPAAAPPTADAPVVRPAPAAPPPTRPATRPPAARPSPAAPVPAAVVVRSGDSLWSLAEGSLRAAGTAPTDGRVAREWPRWWAANREAVGDDPDLLLPGTVLRPPPGSAAPR